jgi:hypothetical protein
MAKISDVHGAPGGEEAACGSKFPAVIDTEGWLPGLSLARDPDLLLQGHHLPLWAVAGRSALAALGWVVPIAGASVWVGEFLLIVFYPALCSSCPCQASLCVYLPPSQLVCVFTLGILVPEDSQGFVQMRLFSPSLVGSWGEVSQHDLLSLKSASLDPSHPSWISPTPVCPSLAA